MPRTILEIEDDLQLVEFELNDLNYELAHFAYSQEDHDLIRHSMMLALARRAKLQAELKSASSRW